MAKTLYDKIWDEHIVKKIDDQTYILYIDRHLVHEVTSPQAFESLKINNRSVRRPNLTLATADHNVPTFNRDVEIENEESRIQVDALTSNAFENQIEFYNIDDKRQGIVHVVGPEQGFTLPGTTVVCGDSHTSTHGAFGSLAFGIGTSEVEHVLTTQTLLQRKSKNMLVKVNGNMHDYLTAKDIVLAIIGKIGTSGGTGYVIEYSGQAISELSVEGRMTICNMTIEGGARAGLIAPDEKTIEYVKGKTLSPSGEIFDKALENWNNLYSDENAHFDKIVELHTDDITPMVTWGTSPEDVINVDGNIPLINEFGPNKQIAVKRALEYMDLNEGQEICGVKIDKVFIGSCTNSRIEDIREVAKYVKGKKVASNVGAIVVPGSGLVRELAMQEGLDKIIIDAGFEWREAGCSMCLAMNDDKLESGERCASTSNRNFEGRQGRGGRTHLMSPAMAAIAAIEGKITDIRGFK